MARRVDVVLNEILGAITGIEDAVRDQTKASFATSWMLPRALERGVEIISEAIRHIPDEILATRADMPWAEIRAIGNLIRHEYYRVEVDVIWSVIEDDLPALRVAIEAMLHDLPR